MAMIKSFCEHMEINASIFSKEEIALIEAEIFAQLCTELKAFFRQKNQEYLDLLKLSKNKEDAMLDNNFIRFIIEDTLSTGEYNMAGFAYYTDTHEDIIQEIIDGRNTNPSANLLRKSIDLHRSVRRDLYHKILQKVLNEKILSH